MPDLREMLTDSAREPALKLDPASVVAGARRRLRRRRSAMAVAGVLVLASGATLLPEGFDDEPRRVFLAPGGSETAPTPPPTSSLGPDVAVRGTMPNSPSQSPEDAVRDHVPADVAAMRFSLRVNPLQWTAGRQQVRTAEGVWVVSQLDSPSVSDLIRDPDRFYGGDGRLSASEYGEVLLLDHARARIKRAYPLPAYPPHMLLVTDDAVYFARGGDGALPNSFIGRVDRATLAMTVRVFPTDGPDSDGKGYGVEPEDWFIDEPNRGIAVESISVRNGRLSVRGVRGRVELDPLTLEILD